MGADRGGAGSTSFGAVNSGSAAGGSSKASGARTGGDGAHASRTEGGANGGLCDLLAEAHALYSRLWVLENVLPNTDAQRCVAHYAELWCLHHAQLIRGVMGLAGATTTGCLLRTHEASLSTLSIGFVNYNFQKTMKNNFTDFICLKTRVL